MINRKNNVYVLKISWSLGGDVNVLMTDPFTLGINSVFLVITQVFSIFPLNNANLVLKVTGTI